MIPQKVIELVRSTADIAFAVNFDGEVVAWNDAAAAAFELPATEAVGRRCGDLLVGIDECGPVCSAECAVRQSAQARRPVRNFDLQVVTPKGRRWFNVSVLIFTETGSPDTYALHIARSVDVRKRLEMLMRDFVRDSETREDCRTSDATNRAAIANAALSRRETAVLRLLSHGLTTSEIADELGISRTTVNNHAQHAMTKLDAHSRLEAIRKAGFAGLI